MRRSPGHYLLILVGGLCAAAGVLEWIRLFWKAVSELDTVSPEGGEGGRLLVWAVTGTVLMILGIVLLHVALDAAERREREEGAPQG